MNRAIHAVANAVLLTVMLFATDGSAGPDKIGFPAGWEKFVLYNVVDRHDNKQYRELYASTQEAVDAAKAGKPLPNGTVLVLAQSASGSTRRSRSTGSSTPRPTTRPASSATSRTRSSTS